MCRVDDLVTATAIRQARSRIDPAFTDSPQFMSPELSAMLGVECWLKVEFCNPIRSFKGRGSSYLAATVPKSARHVLCASAGNFGQAIAYSFRPTGRPVTVYVSRNANPAKVDRIRQLGATVIEHGHDFDEAKLAARDAAGRLAGALFAEDGHDLAITIGAGSIGAELSARQFDAILVPVGNGALISGLACAVKDQHPDTRIVGVVPSAAPSMALSWRARPVPTDTADTRADGVAVRLPVSRALAWMHRWVDDVTTVEEDQIAAAVYELYDLTGLVVEPAAALPLAAARRSPLGRAGRICLILTGSNLDPRMRQALITAAAGPQDPGRDLPADDGIVSVAGIVIGVAGNWPRGRAPDDFPGGRSSR